MSAAMNLIIARGFPEMGTAALDGYNNQRQANEVSRANNINANNAEQDQQFQSEDRARQMQQQMASQGQEAEVQALYQAASELSQMDHNDPKVQKALLAIGTRLESFRAGSGSGLMKMLNPQQDASGFGNVNPGDYTPESLSRYNQSRDYRDLVRQYAPPGQVLVNTPGFGVGLVDKGNPSNRTMLTTPEQEAAAKVDVAAATAGAKEGAKVGVQASAALPGVKENAQQLRGLLTQLESPDVLKWVYGPASIAPVVPGTPQADAVGLWGQINGQAFMQAFSSLKGGGQITEKEGEKATVAITRLSDRKISAKAAKVAIGELRGVIERAEKNAEKRAGLQQNSQAIAPSSGVIDFNDLPE